MKTWFDTEQQALDYNNEQGITAKVPEYIEGRGKWSLVFPLQAHVTVIPHTCATKDAQAARSPA